VAHERFGTARLESDSGVVDLTTGRSERYAHAGSLPTVAPGSLEDDLRRRDFSVNALAIPLSRCARRNHPGVVDPEGGLADLAARRLRILHPRSFHDDPTRALRAARLGPRLGFRLSAGSRRALAEALSARSVERVSGERLRRELEKVFHDVGLGLDPTRALDLAQRWGVLRAIHAGLQLEDGARRDLRRLRASLRAPPWPWSPLRAWVPGFALWLAGVRAEPRRRVLERLALQGAVRERIEEFPGWRARAGRKLTRASRRSAVERQLSGVPDEWLLALHAWLPAAGRRHIERYASEDRERAAPLSGDDLVRLGFSGRSVGQAMARLRAAQLDGELCSREQALALARTLAAPQRP
jgi:tRNA nucleotidyltransferase (CCA-adding enzyme)